MTLAQAMPAPIKWGVGTGQSLHFCRIGLDIWSEFCEYVLDRRTDRINALPFGDDAKASLYKELVGKGFDMEEMLGEAATTEGMRWLVCRCSIDNVTDTEISTLVKLRDMPVKFSKLADIEPPTKEEEVEIVAAGNELEAKEIGA